ncbi:MAG: hypothetical protein A3I32_01770 [Candidatus Yanofskybacteria bacterium RIFCSPLOWO2_02_FULL_45_10]|uniref:Uncharacterized protein n=2 Tax=Candidatus Yanofskyibacteriota TaxID=1752733 RepID=A0A1F8G206_9BACT|nr:MAG: hypothetical protein A3F25_01460 [Candidatus Yanofskybacteria bacterium RIFCSPHIGHO2_12_FULL_45_19b]OGN32105.1 MAG: hypothetical protein A3I32_01770 [Candidatus Yanofskybacteria bacterium RIFCSPLOWO2_02_FULL_45_10]
MRKNLNFSTVVVLLVVTFVLGGIVATNSQGVSAGLSKSNASDHSDSAQAECQDWGASNVATCTAQLNSYIIEQEEAAHRAHCATIWGWIDWTCDSN